MIVPHQSGHAGTIQNGLLDHHRSLMDHATMFSRTRYLLSFLLVTVSTAFVRASESTEPVPTTGAATVTEDSPKSALKGYNAAMRAGDVAGMVSLQYATNDDERHVARSCAQSDLEVGRLIKTAREKFGDDAGKKVSQAISDEGDDDIDAAQQTVDGSHGGVTFAGGGDPTPMILVDGNWKVDIAAMLKQYDGGADAFSDQVIRRGSAAKVTAQELLAGQFANADALVDALKNRMKDAQ
jgi:hypothetical protein